MPKRIGRDLVGAPRLKREFVWQDQPETADADTDSGWAGCRSTCRRTSGGALKLGRHCLKTWCPAQAAVALSSAEAELCALTKGAAQVLGLMFPLGGRRDRRRSDHPHRRQRRHRHRPKGRARQVQAPKRAVPYLWLEDKVKREDFELRKVPRPAHQADLMT